MRTHYILNSSTQRDIHAYGHDNATDQWCSWDEKGVKQYFRKLDDGG